MSKFLILLLLLFSLVVPSYAVSTQVDIFRIQAPDQDLLRKTSTIMISARVELEKLLGAKIQDTINIFIAENRYDFDTATFGGVPDWGIGVAQSQKKLIAVMSPTGENYNQPFREILRHELAHIALFYRTDGNRIPRFMNEGVAMLFAHQWGFGDEMTLAKAKMTGSYLTLAQIDQVNMLNSAQAQIAYAESYQAVKYIINTYGAQTLSDLLDGFKSGRDRDYIFKQVLGMDFAGFDKMFAVYLSNHYHWLMLFTDPNILWIGLALLFILGFLLVRRRRKSIYKKWEDEEKLESTDFDYEESSPWD